MCVCAWNVRLHVSNDNDPRKGTTRRASKARQAALGKSNICIMIKSHNKKMKPWKGILMKIDVKAMP